MVEKLKKIEIGKEWVTEIGKDFNYNSFLTTKSRLKRDGFGEWQSKLSGKTLTIKRTK